jgi:hypothetical protein
MSTFDFTENLSLETDSTFFFFITYQRMLLNMTGSGSHLVTGFCVGDPEHLILLPVGIR